MFKFLESSVNGHFNLHAHLMFKCSNKKSLTKMVKLKDCTSQHKLSWKEADLALQCTALGGCRSFPFCLV